MSLVIKKWGKTAFFRRCPLCSFCEPQKARFVPSASRGLQPLPLLRQGLQRLRESGTRDRSPRAASAPRSVPCLAQIRPYCGSRLRAPAAHGTTTARTTPIASRRRQATRSRTTRTVQATFCSGGQAKSCPQLTAQPQGLRPMACAAVARLHRALTALKGPRLLSQRAAPCRKGLRQQQPTRTSSEALRVNRKRRRPQNPLV